MNLSRKTSINMSCGLGWDGEYQLKRAILIVVVVCVFSVRAQAKYSGGTGARNDPYRIATADDLNDIGNYPNDWDEHFLLVDDINLAGYTGTQLNLIGVWVDWWHPNNRPFTGLFDGNGHTISNFTYSCSGMDGIGLFRAIGGFYGTYGEIRDLGLLDPNVQAGVDGDYVGALVGVVDGGKVAGCYAEAGSVSGNNWVGGLVGGNYGYLTDCFSTCTVVGDDNVGGLVGISDMPEVSNVPLLIINCCSASSAAGINNVGGLVGRNRGPVVDSYATGSVSGEDNVGGLVGENFWGGMAANCYSSAAVTATTHAGGLVGASDDGGASNSFWDVNTSGQEASAGGTPKTTPQMHDPNTFMDAGWDFVGLDDKPGDIWAEPKVGGYPILWWEQSPLPPIPGFSEGTGQPDDPYLIWTAEQLNRIAYNPRLIRVFLKLVNNIDLAGVNFFLIGNTNYPFAGSFDGNGHQISHFSYTSTALPNKGLFSIVDGYNPEIKDLGLADVDIDAGTGDAVGPLVGRLNRGTISGCYAAGGNVSADKYVGGLVGYSYQGKLTGCSSSASVSGNGEVGGLVGRNVGSVSNSDAIGEVTSSGDYHGGLVGWNLYGTISGCCAAGGVSGADYGGGLAGRNHYGRISDSYALGPVVGGEDIGGLVGNNDWGGSVISKCYSTGSAAGTKDVGGLVGSNDSGVIEDSLWDVNSSARANMCGSQDGGVGCDNGNGKTTTEMQDANTFVSASWDFIDESDNGIEDIWRLCNEGAEYPKLAWQFLLGDIVCGDGVDEYDLAVLCKQWLFEELSADVWPDGGDGVVDFMDWAIFADGWQGTNGMDELAAFARQWLKTGAKYYIADVAPDGGDGVVNMLDYCVLAENWLEGF